MTVNGYHDKCRCGHERASHDGSYEGCFYCECSRMRGQLTTLKKMSTAEFRSRLEPRMVQAPGEKSAKCWGNVLHAFGVTFTPTGKGECAGAINLQIARGGYEVTFVRLADAMPDVTQDSAYTLAAFLGMKEHLVGDWIIYLARHVLCIRDGRITDTMGHHQTVARRIESVYRVTRKSDLGLAAREP